ncbi:hypothetical protein QL374_003076 [Salmonella enterica]|nr:hypothetical protein [Salmonella enterica]ELW6562764.1 hypothetical protein [Salmonella enterica]ELZ1403668.1 hypothetical protein [Salmonella enterica]
MTKDRKFSGEFIAFDEIRRKKSHCETIIEVNNKWAVEHPDECDPLKLERENEQASAEITQLDAILATEPPPPELPPRQPLFKVSGMLEEFSVQKVIGYFTDREYDPEAFAHQESRNQVGGLLVAMTGNTAGAAVTGQSQVRMSDASDFVRGKINGVSFSGWLGKTNVKVGDFVEMAVMGREEHYVVYAIALPELRTITMTPYCRHGREIDVFYEYRSGIFLIGGFFTVLLLFVFFASKSLSLEDFLKLVVISYSITAYACFRGVRKQRKRPKPTTLLAEAIFTVLGFNEPKRVDLDKITKEQIKVLPPDLLTSDGREMPSRTSYLDGFFYY